MKLKSCPSCGSKWVKVSRYRGYVKCNACDHTKPTKLWNKRKRKKRIKISKLLFISRT